MGYLISDYIGHLLVKSLLPTFERTNDYGDAWFGLPYSFPCGEN